MESLWLLSYHVLRSCGTCADAPASHKLDTCTLWEALNCEEEGLHQHFRADYGALQMCTRLCADEAARVILKILMLRGLEL